MYPVSLQRCGVDGKEVILWLVHIQYFITEVAPLVSSDAEVIRYLSDNVSCTSVQPYQWYLWKAYVSPALFRIYCLCMSSAVLRVYQHNFTSTHQSVHHFMHVALSLPCIPVQVQHQYSSYIPVLLFVSALVVHPFVFFLSASAICMPVAASAVLASIHLHVSAPVYLC
jgi:hypothetical protein